jgi:hypothetical protein
MIVLVQAHLDQERCYNGFGKSMTTSARWCKFTNGYFSYLHLETSITVDLKVFYLR